MKLLKNTSTVLLSLLALSAHAACKPYEYSISTKTINAAGGELLSGHDGLKLAVDQVGRSQINAFGQGFLHAPNLCTTGDGSALLVNGTLIRLSEGKKISQVLSGEGTYDNPYLLSTKLELQIRGAKVASVERIDEYRVPDLAIKTTFNLSDLDASKKYKLFFIKDTHLEYDFDPSPDAEENDKVTPFKDNNELGVYRLKDSGKNKANLLMKYIPGSTSWDKYSVKGYRGVADLLSPVNGRETRGMDNLIQQHPDDTGIGLEWNFTGETEFSTTLVHVVSRYLLSQDFSVVKNSTNVDVTMTLSNSFKTSVTEPSRVRLDKQLILDENSIRTTCAGGVSALITVSDAQEYQFIDFSEQTLDANKNCKVIFSVQPTKNFKPSQHAIVDATGLKQIALADTSLLTQTFTFEPEKQRLLKKSDLSILLENKSGNDISEAYTFKLDKNLSLSLGDVKVSSGCTEKPDLVEQGMMANGYRTYQLSAIRYTGGTCKITLPVTLMKEFNSNSRAAMNLDGEVKAELAVNNIPEAAGLALTTYVKAKNPEAFKFFGNKIAQSKNLMVVGKESNGGDVVVYELKDDKWNFVQAISGQYKSIAISPNEKTIAINAPNEQVTEAGKTFKGLVYLYQKNSSGLWVKAQTLHSDQHSSDSTKFGHKIAISDDYIVINETRSRPDKKVHLFSLKNGTWQADSVYKGSGYYFGDDFALNNNTLFIGEYNAKVGGVSYAGNVHVIDVSVCKKMDCATSISSSAPKSGGYFGQNLFATKNQLLVSEPGTGREEPRKVHVYTYDLNTQSWKLGNTIKGDKEKYTAKFGASITGDDNVIYISDYQADNYVGQVLRYQKAANGWEKTNTLTGYNDGDYFGYKVSAVGDRLLISAKKESSKFAGIRFAPVDDSILKNREKSSSGAAYIYEPNASLVVETNGLVTKVTDVPLILQNNNQDDLLVVENGLRYFLTRYLLGSDYEVSVSKQPQGHECEVESPAKGKIKPDSKVSITCTPKKYSLSVNIDGLTSGEELKFSLNGTEKTVNNGNTQLSDAITYNDEYKIEDLQSPAGKNCLVDKATPATGRVVDETTVKINCSSDKFDVFVSVSGLDKGEQLQLLFNDTKTTIKDNHTTEIAKDVLYGTEYKVSFTSPTNKVCRLKDENNASGKITTEKQFVIICSKGNFSLHIKSQGLKDTEKASVIFASKQFSVGATGKVLLADGLSLNETYEIAVTEKPEGKACDVKPSAAGVIKNNTILTLECSVAKHDISVEVSGLEKSSDAKDALIIKNTTDDQMLTFTESTTVKVDHNYDHGERFEFQITQQPRHMQCKFVRRIGLVKSDLRVFVKCAGKKYPLSVSVQGLSSGETLTLTSNNQTPLTWTDDSEKSFGEVISGAGFDVVVKKQPKSQHCQIMQGKGEMLKAHTVKITCGSKLSYKKHLPLYLLSDVNESRIIGVADLNQDGTFSDNERNVYFDTSNESRVGKNNGTLTDTLINDILVDGERVYLLDLHAQSVYLAKDENRDGDIQDANEIRVWFSENNAEKLPMRLPQAVVKGNDEAIYILSPGLENSADANKKLDRIYRTTDENGDGDANDANEASIYADLSTIMTPLYPGFDPSAGLDLAVLGDTFYLLDTQGLGNGLIFSMKDTNSNGKIDKNEVKKAFTVEDIFPEDSVIHKVVANKNGIHIVFTPYYFYDHTKGDYADYPATKRQLVKLIDENQDGVFDKDSEVETIWNAVELTKYSRFYYSWAFDFDNENNLIMVSNETDNYTGSGVWLVNAEEPENISLLAGGSDFTESHKETAISEIRAVGATQILNPVQPPKPPETIFKDSFETL